MIREANNTKESFISGHATGQFMTLKQGFTVNCLTLLAKAVKKLKKHFLSMKLHFSARFS